MIGTGATAVQLVPELAKVAGHLVVFQRSACWCGQRGNRELTPVEAEVGLLCFACLVCVCVCLCALF